MGKLWQSVVISLVEGIDVLGAWCSSDLTALQSVTLLCSRLALSITLLHRWACLTYFDLSDGKRDFRQTLTRYRRVRLAA